VSVLTLHGRVIVPVIYQGRWNIVGHCPMRGQADLVYRDGMFFLTVVLEVSEPSKGPEPEGWLGVDRGIVNCQRCGLAGPADHIGAGNIAARVAVIRPHAA
jgi:putative transposase